MELLSVHLERMRERPEMYIGEATPQRLETFILGFDAAHPIEYHEEINVRLFPGNRGISVFDSFEAAFNMALKGAEIAESMYYGSNEV